MKIRATANQPISAGHRNMWARFASNIAGNVAILFTLSLPVILLTLGTAVDFSRGANADRKIADAVDAAVLSATSAYIQGTVTKRNFNNLGFH